MMMLTYPPLFTKLVMRVKWHNGRWALWDSLEHQSPTFLAPRTGFVQDSFSMDQSWGDGFGMIQAHYIQAHLLLWAQFLTGLDQHCSAVQRLGTSALEPYIQLGGAGILHGERGIKNKTKSPCLHAKLPSPQRQLYWQLMLNKVFLLVFGLFFEQNQSKGGR